MSSDRVPLKTALLDHLHRSWAKNPKKWISGDTLEKFSQTLGFKASNGRRRMQELAHNGTVNRQEENGYVQYKYR